MPGNVFANNIKLNIDRVADRETAKIGMLPGVRNDRHAELVVLWLYHGEAHAIEADRPFVYQQMLRVWRVAKSKSPTTTGFHYFQASGYCVDMALYDMSVQPSAHRQAALQVDQTTGLPVGQVATKQRFFHRSHGMGVRGQADYSEANPVVAEALVDLQFVGNGAFDQKMPISAVLFNGADGAEGFDDAGKHNSMINDE